MTASRKVALDGAHGNVLLGGVVFDMDGTLCEPQAWMFSEMRKVLGIEGLKIDILSHIAGLSGEERVEAERKILEVEDKAMAEMIPQKGLNELFEFLESHRILITICTRNQMRPVNHLVATFVSPHVKLSEPVVTRAFKPTKPAPDALLHISESWGIRPETMVMVGDSRDDMYCGLNAGCTVILVRHAHNAHLIEEIPEIDAVVNTLDEIIPLLQNGLPQKPRHAYLTNTTGAGY